MTSSGTVLSWLAVPEQAEFRKCSRKDLLRQKAGSADLLGKEKTCRRVRTSIAAVCLLYADGNAQDATSAAIS